MVKLRGKLSNSDKITIRYTETPNLKEQTEGKEGEGTRVKLEKEFLGDGVIKGKEENIVRCATHFRKKIRAVQIGRLSSGRTTASFKKALGL